MEAHADPRQRPLFEGWGRATTVALESAAEAVSRLDERRDAEG